MTRRDSVAETILRPLNPTLIIVLGVYTVLWGLWILIPLWMVFPLAPHYAIMAALAPEWFWGVIAIVAGCFTIHGALRPKYRNLKWGAIVGFFHWTTIGFLYLFASWQSTSWLSAFAFATYCGLIWLNIKVNKKRFE